MKNSGLGPANWPLGAVVPMQTALSTGLGPMPDPGEVEHDSVLQAFRLLGRVQGPLRGMTMGWGFDVVCPWVEEHTARTASGTGYVPITQRFHCHHGHCQTRDMSEVRLRLDELLRTPPPGGPGTTLAALEFDAVDPGGVALPAGWAVRKATAVLGSYEATEDGLALAFAAEHAGRLRFDHLRGKWFVWTGWFWRPDVSAVAFRWVRRLARAFRGLQVPGAKPLGKIAAAGAIERGARADEKMAVDGLSCWDHDPWIVGAPNCEIDLKTGRVVKADPAHGVTRQLLVAPRTMPTPVWDQFLWDSTGGDVEMITFLQAWCGYCLTGDTNEEKFVFIYGSGGNGKSTFIGVLGEILHDYAVGAPPDTFVQRKAAKHETEVARLAGARAVLVTETEEGTAFNAVRLKEWTSTTAGKLVGRFMHKDFFEFRPEFKITLAGNHQPRLDTVDAAFERRFVLVPFTQRPARVDLALRDRLRDEYPGILCWMIEGENLRRAMNGLSAMIPASAVAAARNYLADQDVFQAWAQDRCAFGPGLSMTVREAFEDYRLWCADNDCHATVGERHFSRKFLEVFPQCQFQRANARKLEGASLLPQVV